MMAYRWRKFLSFVWESPILLYGLYYGDIHNVMWRVIWYLCLLFWAKCIHAVEFCHHDIVIVLLLISAWWPLVKSHLKSNIQSLYTDIHIMQYKQLHASATDKEVVLNTFIILIHWDLEPLVIVVLHVFDHVFKFFHVVAHFTAFASKLQANISVKPFV